MEYEEEDMDRILEWMNWCREIMNLPPNLDRGFLLEMIRDRDCKQSSCGGFTFIKTKRGFHIKPELGKLLVSNKWRKTHPSKKRKPDEIQEHTGHPYKCPQCEKDGNTKGNFFKSPIYVYGNGKCELCGYSRPTDKEIIKLWNEKKSLKEMCKLLEEPTTTYIKTRLRKYGLYERIGWNWQDAFDENKIYSVYAWERVNHDKFPLKPCKDR